MTFPNARDPLYRYLLGELTESEIREVEERSLTDDNYKCQLQCVEPELIAAYVSDDLTMDKRKSFEQYFLQSEERLKKLRIAELLYEYAKTKGNYVPEVSGPLHRYLLGKSSDEERIRIEKNLATDSDHKKGLEIAENELIAAYTAKKLTEKEHEILGQYFFSSEEKIEKLRFAEAVYEYYEQVQWIEAQDRANARLLNRLRSRLANSIRIQAPRERLPQLVKSLFVWF